MVLCSILHFTFTSDRRLDDINVQASGCDSLRTITKFSFFVVLERWLIYDCETECSFVYLICLISASRHANI